MVMYYKTEAGKKAFRILGYIIAIPSLLIGVLFLGLLIMPSPSTVYKGIGAESISDAITSEGITYLFRTIHGEGESTDPDLTVYSEPPYTAANLQIFPNDDRVETITLLQARAEVCGQIIDYGISNKRKVDLWGGDNKRSYGVQIFMRDEKESVAPCYDDLDLYLEFIMSDENNNTIKEVDTKIRFETYERVPRGYEVMWSSLMSV